MKYSFKNDYSEGCHPRILEALVKNNFLQQSGYGLDEFSLEAEKLILQKMNVQNSKIFFVSGGTQANLIVISAFLRPHESVISAETGHIFTNESYAIEATGHKICSVMTETGKLTPKHVESVLQKHLNVPHQGKPKMVYISNSTEAGTIYSKNELDALHLFCKKNELYLFMDGARLGHALTAETNDLSLEDIAKFTDVFYLGGTKNGALMGEAIVINNQYFQEDFEFHIKQRGAMLAKGRVLGIQFLELLKDDLYFDLAKHANHQAMKIKKAFIVKGISFLYETFSNQLFPILELSEIENLAKYFDFYIWKKLDNHKAAIRIITSWSTSDEMVEQFIGLIK